MFFSPSPFFMEQQTESQEVSFLDRVYSFVINGIPKADKPIQLVVNEYRSRYPDTEKAIKEFIRVQKIKCSTTGFVTGLGGFLTLPVTLPADLASSLYIEMRMIAAIAAMRGYNVLEDKVKTLVYVCMVGNTAGDLVKQAGIKAGNQLAAKKLLPKITGEMIKKINQAVGFRLLTKGGTKGVINIGKAIPLIGGFVGGTYNLIEVGVFAKRAKAFFD